MPQVRVALLPQLLPADWSDGNTLAIVIDTLRFTTTACVALANGAASIAVVSDIEQARHLAQSSNALLCGERHCVRIAGFDLGNSPAEYMQSVVIGRPLIFSTTNGTVAVEAAQRASHIALGSLLNRHAVARWATNFQHQTLPRQQQGVSPGTGKWAIHPPENRERQGERGVPPGTGKWDVYPATARGVLSERGVSPGVGAWGGHPGDMWVICAGTDGRVAAEDVLTAGAICEHLYRLGEIKLANDSAWLALDAWLNVEREGSLLTRLRQARGGSNLVEAGFADDVATAAQLDSILTVPEQNAGGLFVESPFAPRK